MITTTNFSALLYPGIRKIYGDAYADYPEEYSNVFDVLTSSKVDETDKSLTTFGLVPTKTEGKPVTYDDTYMGYSKTYTHAAYGLGFQVTRELFEDDLYNKISSMPKALARSVRQTIEILGATILNNAFTSGTGADGQYLCDSDHPLIGGGTWSNKPSVAADLDVTSLEQAYIDIAAWVDDRGLKMRVLPKKLIIHPSEEFNVRTILQSASLPGTANNDINPVKGMIDYVVMHWLTDSDAWFLKTDVPNGLTWFWRRKPEFTKDNDFDTENAKFKTTFRCSQGWTDARCIYGSAGS